MAPKKNNPLVELPLTRRQFIKSTAAGAAAVYMAPSLTWSSINTKSRVVSISHTNMIKADERIDSTIARQCVDHALLILTGKQDLRDAWRQIFPKLKTEDTIGLKVNALSRKCPTHPEISYAIANSLIESLEVNPNNIIIWDRTTSELVTAKYTPNETDKGIRCFGTVESFSVARWLFNQKQDESSGIGYDDKEIIAVGNNTTSRLSRVLTQKCTYLINVPVLKNHSKAGVTLSLKNHYGTIDNPRDCHGNYCDPYTAKINAAPQIRDKTKLVVCDAAYGVYKGGPLAAPQWMQKSVLAAVDPVALDTVGMQIINNQRKQNGLESITGMAVHLNTAEAFGLGNSDLKNIELKETALT